MTKPKALLIKCVDLSHPDDVKYKENLASTIKEMSKIDKDKLIILNKTWWVL